MPHFLYFLPSRPPTQWLWRTPLLLSMMRGVDESTFFVLVYFSGCRINRSTRARIIAAWFFAWLRGTLRNSRLIRNHRGNMRKGSAWFSACPERGRGVLFRVVLRFIYLCVKKHPHGI